MIGKPIYLPALIQMQGGTATKSSIQRVRRFLRRAEKKHGVKLLIQDGAGGPLYTTVPLLRRYLPELFSDDDLMEVKKRVAALEGSQTAIKQRIRALGAEMRGLKSVVTERR